MATRVFVLRGFALVELILALLLAGLLALVLFGGLLSLRRAFLPPDVSCEGEPLAESPSFVPMPAALELHRLFLERLEQSTAAYVFGGTGLGGEDRGVGKVLKCDALPALEDFSPGLPMSAQAFQQTYASVLAPVDNAQNAADFSVLLLGAKEGRLAPTCLVQCRSRPFSMPECEGSWMRREASLVDADGTQARYVFAERVLGGTSPFVGAVHTWFRRLDSSVIAEEGPACVVFPDPWRFQGSREGESAAPAQSRFAYFIPTGR